MAAKKRTRTQRLTDLIEIERLDQRNLTQQEIADVLAATREYKITQQMISEDMREIKALHEAGAAVKIDREKGKMKSHLEALIRENYEAWDRSQQDAVTITEKEVFIKGKKKGDDVSVPAIERTIQRKGQVGDPRFTGEVRALLKQYAELYGLEAAKKLEGSLAAGAIELIVRYDNPRNKPASTTR